jgi:hypothetical protein
LIRSAYLQKKGCPPRESFLAESQAGLSVEERAELTRHANSCPACASERDLAAAFDASNDELDALQAELDPIVASLEAAAPLRVDRGDDRVVPLRARKSAAPARWRGVAAAAVLAVAAVSLWLVSRAPAPGLPSIGSETVVRGTRIDIVQPVGDLAELPVNLEWKTAPDASEYRVRLLAVDDTVLWETAVSSGFVALPTNLLERLHPAVVYTWQVEARDSEGKTLARSERVRFRVRPSTGTDGR